MERIGCAWRRAATLLASTAILALGLPATVAGAQESENAGGGVATGTIAFDPPVRLGEGCRGTDFSISGTSETAVVNTVITAYVGPVELSGTGRDACPAGLSQSGAFELTVTGETPNGSTLDCDLDGTYSRIGTLASVTTEGTCAVNAYPTEVTFVSEVAIVPNDLSPMRTAAFVAPFAVFP